MSNWFLITCITVSATARHSPYTRYMMQTMKLRVLFRLLSTIGGIAVIALVAWAATEGLNKAVAFATIIAAVPVIGYITSLGKSLDRETHPASTPDQVELARRKLAELVLAQWRAEAVARPLDDPSPSQSAGI